MRMRRGEGRARVSESHCGARGGADAVVQVGRHEAWDGVWTPWRDVFSVARGLYELISMCELRRAGFSLLSRPAPFAPLLLLLPPPPPPLARPLLLFLPKGLRSLLAPRCDGLVQVAGRNRESLISSEQ